MEWEERSGLDRRAVALYTMRSGEPVRAPGEVYRTSGSAFVDRVCRVRRCVVGEMRSPCGINAGASRDGRASVGEGVGGIRSRA